MTQAWRILDTGLRCAAENIALNKALLEARQQADSMNTLRFLQFTPSALLGFHQSAEQELNLEYCRAHQIAVQRRITGGGAIYFDQGQLGWELYLHKRDVASGDMQAIARRICTAAALGISALGVKAQFRPRNDIEVDGKKISGTGGVFDGDVLMYQGSLLLQFDIHKMLKVLRIPAEKLADKAISSAKERVTSLNALLGTTPDIARVKKELVNAFATNFAAQLSEGGLTSEESRLFSTALAEVQSDAWINQQQSPRSALPLLTASQKFTGGLVQVTLALDQRQMRLKQVWFSGDFFVSPRRAILDLEASLRDTLVTDLNETIPDFFARNAVDILGITAEDFLAVVHGALKTATVPA